MLQNNFIIKGVIPVLAIAALGLTIIPALMHFYGRLESADVNVLMAIGMVLWFLTGSFWLGRKKRD
jgi:hypothetical protein